MSNTDKHTVCDADKHTECDTGKREYVRPAIKSIRVDNTETVMAASDGNFWVLPTDEMNIITDGEEVNPKDALSKGHNSVWDDDWDNE